MTYDLGDVVSLSVSITDAAGSAADATTVTLTVTKPDGASETPAVTHAAVGSYTCDYTPATAGRYTVRWVATGTNASAFTDVFDVRAAASTQLLSLADAKLALNMTAPTNDEELRGYIEATTDLIESRIGPVVQRQISDEFVDLMGRTIFNELTTAGTRAFVLRERPVISVDAVSSAIISGVTYTPSDFYVDSQTGIVRRLDGGTIFGPLKVTYTAGRTGAIPTRIIQAAKVLLRHLWMTQRGSATRGRGEDDTANYAASYSMPNRVLELLEADLRTPGIG